MHKEKTKKPARRCRGGRRGKSEKQTTSEQAETDQSATSPPTQTKESKWSPLQQEQVELAKQLDAYISEFQQKLLRLNFEPSRRELVILFIMNLHPRWRRMVEPVELSFNTWVEAAAYARLHCARVSAILGCEDIESSPIFKTESTRALRDSGYFAPDSSPMKISKDTTSIRHLLLSEEQHAATQKVTEIARTAYVQANNEDEPVQSSSPMNDHVDVSKKKLPSVSEDKDKRQGKTDDAVNGVKKETEISSIPASTPTSTPPTATANANIKVTTSTATTSSSLSNPAPASPATAVSSLTPAPASQEINNSKNQKPSSTTPVTALKSNDSQSEGPSICYRVPPEHSGVNLSFLELTINGKKVRGLLAKLRWGSSAMSLDCVRRLGLPMKETDNFCIYTDFGYEDSIGIMTLPIIHPADSSLRSEMEIQVLPQIYDGKVDLVLGADFFYFYNPSLNIKTRSIRFLEKETPYIVSKIE